MTRTPVDSSNIKSVGYNADTKTLEIEFHSGGVFLYKGVPADTHAALVKAKSVGGYFHAHIASKHRGVKSE